MKYIDLHCDALTKEGVPSVRGETLRAGNCALQCFAAFVDVTKIGPSRRFAYACSLFDRFEEVSEREGLFRITRPRELKEGVNALLTVEEGGAIEGREENLEAFYRRGVRMMTLTWNFPNELGFPNSDPERPGRREERGLTARGREIVERMIALHMAVDVSHGSDGLFYDVAALCKAKGTPFVASHSNAAQVCDCPRNLLDGQLRLLADCGGVVGLNFCPRFLSPGFKEEERFEAILAHAAHIVRVGGEDVLAIGSDFDGISGRPALNGPAELPALFSFFVKKFGERVAEKIFYFNAYRALDRILQ